MVNQMIRVLLIDDEAPFRASLRRVLSPPAFSLEGHETLESFLEAVRSRRHDLLLIDWNLWSALGTDVCAALRAEGETRAIGLISALLEIEFARRQALEAGASDFIFKGISVEEWRLRVTTLARDPRYRSSSAGSGVHQLDGRVHVAGAVELRDGAAFLRSYRVDLRPLEYKVLEYLVAHAGTAVPVDALFEAVWKEPSGRTPATVDSQRACVATAMSRLRGKLGASAAMIETTRGGYLVRQAGARAQGT